VTDSVGWFEFSRLIARRYEESGPPTQPAPHNGAPAADQQRRMCRCCTSRARDSNLRHDPL